MSSKQKILEMMSAYLEDFNRKEPERLVRYFHIPCIGITSAGIVHLASTEDVLALFRASLAQLASAGFERSDWVDIRLQMLNDKTVMAACEGVRYDTAGQVLEEIGATYTLSNSGQGWKIVTLVMHAPDIARKIGAGFSTDDVE